MNIIDDFLKSISTNADVPDLITQLDDSDVLEVISTEVINAIPVLREMAALARLGQSIHAHYYTKRILTFLLQLESISDKDKDAFLRKQSSNPRHEEKSGEIALQYLDRLDTTQQAKMLGKAFSHRIRDESETASLSFERHAHVIKNLDRYLTIQLRLHYSEEDTLNTDKNAARILQNYGLLDITMVNTISGSAIQSIYKRNEFGEFFFKNLVSE